MAEPTTLGRLWKLALALTSFAATGVLCLYPLVDASYQGRLARDADRTPTSLESGVAHPDAVARWAWRDEHLDFWYVDVYMLGVLDPSADPPPGLTAWPAPGEVYASRALLDRAGAADFVARYGALVGVVDIAGLADPGERLLYVGVEPEQLDPERSFLIPGFGTEPDPLDNDDDIGHWGTALYQQPRTVFWPGIAFFGILPVLIMALVTVRLGGKRRDRRLAVLAVLGAGRLTRAGYLLREVWPSVVGGAAAATALVGVAMSGTWSLPFAHYTVVGSDLRPLWWTVLLLAVLASGLVLTMIVAAHWHGRGAAFRARPAARPRRIATWPLVLLALMVPATFYGYHAFAAGRPEVSTMIAMSGAAVGLLLVGPATTMLTAVLAQSVVAMAKRASLPVTLVAGRALSATPRPVAQATIAISTLVLLVIQIQVWMTIVDPIYRNAEAVHHLNRDRSLLVEGSEAASIVPALPPTVVALAEGSTADGKQLVWGECHAFERVLGWCPHQPSTVNWASARLPQASHWFQTEAVAMVAPITTDPPETDTALDGYGELVLFTTNGRPLSRDRIATIAFRQVKPPPAVRGPGDPWLGGGLVDRDQGRWYGYGGAIALTLILVTAGLALIFETVRVGRRLAPLGQTGNRRQYHRLAMVLVGLPMVVATASGLAVGVGLVQGPTSPGQGGVLPTGLVVALGLIGGLLATAISLLAGRYTATAARDSAREDE